MAARIAPLFLATFSARIIVLSVGFYNSTYALNERLLFNFPQPAIRVLAKQELLA
jgi:hypothetical protein